ncbi:MAG: RNA polymerase factor sigma-54 [Syntrophomonadaceae bacterium]|nr:RNA polymerase factor sigma-54 [Syntrophomonadaceae bacterium]
MRLTHDIFLEQQQKLLMTPELRQAIAILQMSTLELGEHIQKEMEENPFLDEKEPEEVPEQEKREAEAEAEANNALEQWMEYHSDRDYGYMPQEREEEKSFENYVTSRPSLVEHLEFQLRMLSRDDQDLPIGEYLIGSIDDNGYLTVELAEVAARLEVPEARVEKVLKMIHSFHPHGVGARDLSECLMIQLCHYGKNDPIITEIVQNYLEDIGRGRLNRIAQALNISVQEVQEICDLIRTLDPKPGLQYSNSEQVKYIKPDIFVEKIDGEYVVIVNDFQFPRLTINRTYEKILRQPEAFSQEARQYLEEKIGSAMWLIKSIEQRRMTLYKVARCIVDIQKDFLDNGIAFLKPLTLREVADIVEVHESTVSRATTNKYMETPQGLYELKYFFSTGVQCRRGGERISARSIKKQIEEMVAQEDPTQPLSDEQIAQNLQEQGISISRRTIAKYRNELGIASTIIRRRY